MQRESWKDNEQVINEKTHSLFVVIVGTPETLFEMQRELFSHTGPDVELKKFEIKPIANS